VARFLTPLLRGDLPARVLRNQTSHRALFISDLYVVANELTRRPALFAAERQNDAFAFFRLACGIKANYERALLRVLTVGAEHSKLFVVVEHCFDGGKAAASIR